MIKEPWEAQRRPLKILLYGQPGIGKSTLAMSAPNPIVIDWDDGIHRVAIEHRKAYASPKRFSDFQNMIDSNAFDKYDSIVIDTFGKMVDMMAMEVQGYSKVLSQQGWGQVKNMFTSLITKLSSLNKHLIFTAHEIEEDDEVNGRKIKIKRISSAGASRKELPRELDMIGYMQINDGRRTIQFDPSDAFFAKNSLGLKGQFHITEDHLKDFLTVQIIQVNDQKALQDAESARKYHDLIKFYTNMIDAINSADAANVFYKGEYVNIIHIFNSEACIKHLLLNKVRNLGLSYDKETKTFI